MYVVEFEPDAAAGAQAAGLVAGLPADCEDQILSDGRERLGERASKPFPYDIRMTKQATPHARLSVVKMVRPRWNLSAAQDSLKM